jgi:hypothetical protein
MAPPPAKRPKFIIDNILGDNDEAISKKIDGEDAPSPIIAQMDQEAIPKKKPEDYIEQLSFNSRFNPIFKKVQYVSIFKIKVNNIK